jgi:hypothetical protein
MENDTITVGEVNAEGRAALTEWLEANLSEPDHASRYVDNVIKNFDGSFAEDQGMMFELRGAHSRTGNPAIYTFSRFEYDLVVYDEMGDRMSVDVCPDAQISGNAWISS